MMKKLHNLNFSFPTLNFIKYTRPDVNIHAQLSREKNDFLYLHYI